MNIRVTAQNVKREWRHCDTRRNRVSQLNHLSLTFCAVTRVVILHSFVIWFEFSTIFALYFFAYMKSYDKSPFSSSAFNSTMKNTRAFFCVETFTSGHTFNSAEYYTAFTTLKKFKPYSNIRMLYDHSCSSTQF